MSRPPRVRIPALPVRQWLDEWDKIDFDPSQHRKRPEEQFYIFSIPAKQLRALCDIRRRTAQEQRERSADLGIQRRHNEKRSLEISEYAIHGFPWSSLSISDRKSGAYNNLKKPGWLPTAIVVNILVPSDSREGRNVSQGDLIDVIQSDGFATLLLPYAADQESWRPTSVAPMEVIDGQHRLWAFEEQSDLSGDFELPVVAFHGLDISWQAYLFYVINIKPTKINTSLAFDLYPLLRTEDWLERAGGPQIYRESRAQELTEALWAYEDSPWHGRIDMLGEHGRKYVTQASWIRSLVATFIKKWEGSGIRIGGLFGAPPGEQETVLPWTRSQQAAILIYTWKEFENAVSKITAPWTQELREAEPASEGDAAFRGSTTLLNTDQGVRAVLAVVNDLCFVDAGSLDLRSWAASDFVEGTSAIGITEALNSLRQQQVANFIASIVERLAEYDWRTFAAPGLAQDEQSAKARFRGSTGYRELRRDLLEHLSTGPEDGATTATRVLHRLGWD